MQGVPLPTVLPISADTDIASVLPISSFSADEYVILTTERGWIKKTPVKAFETMSSRGLIITKLEEVRRVSTLSAIKHSNSSLRSLPLTNPNREIT